MEKFSRWLEKYLMPVAEFVSGQKHLAAMRDGFIAIMPMTLIGATVTMLNFVFLKPDSLFGVMLNKGEWYATTLQPFIDKTFLAINGQIWWGTLALGVIFSVFTISYNLAKSYNVDGLSAGVVSTVCYLILLPQAASEAAGWGTLSWESFNSSAIFAGLLTAFLATEIFRIVTQKNFVIKLPEQVPPAVSKAFLAIIPGGVAMVIFAIISVTCTQVFQVDVKTLIYQTIQTPLSNLGQSPLTYIIFILLSQIFWFFGLHGMNIVGPILDATYASALQQNFEAVTVAGTEPLNIITRNLVDVYGMHGGSGATLGLIIAIFLFSKRA
ncbi:MAG: PTS sugar transporter subunit IIC, partial [Clostridium sp.]